MGAGASIEQEEAKQRVQCDELFDSFNVSGNDGKINYLELKKGYVFCWSNNVFSCEVVFTSHL